MSRRDLEDWGFVCVVQRPTEYDDAGGKVHRGEASGA